MAANERAGVMLSVIIPVYNVEKYLNACLDSVISQSFTDYEILLVDDGSTDSSAGLCLEAAAGAPDKIFVFRKENGGASSARNFGLRQASGKYVLFLDSDDHLAPNALETAVKAAESAEADLTVFEAHAFDDETGAASGNYTYSISYPVSDGLSMMKEMYRRNEFHFVVWMMLFKREFLLSRDLFFLEGVMYEDVAYVFKAFTLADKAVHIHEKLYFRRFRRGSVMTSAVTARNFVSLVAVCKELDAFYRSHFSADDGFARAYISRQCLNAFNLYRALPEEDKSKLRPALEQFKSELEKKEWYGDKALRARAFGYGAWAAVRAFQKLFP